MRSIGEGALFTREDAIEAAWTVIEPVLRNHRPAVSLSKGHVGPGGSRRAARRTTESGTIRRRPARANERAQRHRLSARLRQHAARQRSRAARSSHHLETRVRRANAATAIGRSSRSVAPSSAMRTIWARCRRTAAAHEWDTRLLTDVFVSRRLPVRRAAVSGRTRGHSPSEHDRTHRDPLRRRRGVSAAQGASAPDCGTL